VNNVHIKVIGVGKIKEKYFTAGIAEYQKRLGAFAKVDLLQVRDEKAPESLSAAEMEQVKAAEGTRILEKIKDNDWVIALAIEGKQRPSEVFAKEIEDLGTYGHPDITFVIGGSLGLSPAVMQRANDTLSFGKLTLPHQLMRLVLMEQIYRAFMISAGRPYHK
jgi:23S rRNA (pseudouridine1915-N3)-methyltransferase